MEQSRELNVNFLTTLINQKKETELSEKLELIKKNKLMCEILNLDINAISATRNIDNNKPLKHLINNIKGSINFWFWNSIHASSVEKKNRAKEKLSQDRKRLIDALLSIDSDCAANKA